MSVLLLLCETINVINNVYNYYHQRLVKNYFNVLKYINKTFYKLFDKSYKIFREYTLKCIKSDAQKSFIY